jgi:hypothetical protein
VAATTEFEVGVRKAIELLGNEVLRHRRRHSKDQPELAAQLGRECVTYMYRLLFLSHVEARGQLGWPSTPLISAAKLRNEILQEIVGLLALGKQLGIHRLGAVYEGLLSYTGRFDEAGNFSFRLAGRDREKSASYYTPELLTRCVTKYTVLERLGELGELTGTATPTPRASLRADELLDLTICEPAMGSGAFLSEAVSQLAHLYLERKQTELGKRIPTGRTSANGRR